jgi:hypothetical protein
MKKILCLMFLLMQSVFSQTNAGTSVGTVVQINPLYTLQTFSDDLQQQIWDIESTNGLTLETAKDYFVELTNSVYTGTVALASSAIQPNTTATVAAVKFGTNTTLSWNPDSAIQSFEYPHPDGGTITVNQESYRMWKNVDNVAISNGQPVCIYGGSGRIASIRLADADDLELNCVIGVYTAEDPLPVGEIGRITVGVGAIHDAPLARFVIGGVLSENDKMYLSDTKGFYEITPQTYPVENILVGVCKYARIPSNKYDMELAIHHMKTWDMLDEQYRFIATTNTVAGSNIVGRLRYYSTASNSYVDVCMKTGTNSYSWVNIQQYSW